MNRPTAGLVLAFVLAASIFADEGHPAAWLGIYLDHPEARETEDGSMTTPPGARIRGIIGDSPADRAGLRARDRILAVETERLASPNDLLSTLSAMEAGRWISLTVERGGEELMIEARLAERPTDMKGFKIRTGWIGIEAIDLPESLRRHFGAPEDAGVMLSLVEPGSPADVAGLRLGDVVFEAGGVPVRSAADLAERVATGGVGNTLEVTLARNGLKEITVEPVIATAPD